MFSYLNDHPGAAEYPIDRVRSKITLLKIISGVYLTGFNWIWNSSCTMHTFGVKSIRKFTTGMCVIILMPQHFTKISKWTLQCANQHNWFRHNNSNYVLIFMMSCSKTKVTNIVNCNTGKFSNVNSLWNRIYFKLNKNLPKACHIICQIWRTDSPGWWRPGEKWYYKCKVL